MKSLNSVYLFLVMVVGIIIIGGAPLSKSYIDDAVGSALYKIDSTIVVMCAEESATNLTTGYKFSFGNGSALGNRRGVVMPDTARLVGMSLGVGTAVVGSATIQLHENAVALTGASLTLTSGSSTYGTKGNIIIDSGKVANFYVSSAPTSGGNGAVACAWLKFRTSDLE